MLRPKPKWYRAYILFPFLCVVLVIAGCTAQNHLGNPLTLPVRGVLAGVENSSYNARRGRVKTYLIENKKIMQAEGFNGPVTNALLVGMPPEQREKVERELADVSDHSDYAERATVIVMVHQG